VAIVERRAFDNTIGRLVDNTANQQPAPTSNPWAVVTAPSPICQRRSRATGPRNGSTALSRILASGRNDPAHRRDGTALFDTKDSTDPGVQPPDTGDDLALCRSLTSSRPKYRSPRPRGDRPHRSHADPRPARIHA
jgi:hypothetical protein